MIFASQKGHPEIVQLWQSQPDIEINLKEVFPFFFKYFYLGKYLINILLYIFANISQTIRTLYYKITQETHVEISNIYCSWYSLFLHSKQTGALQIRIKILTPLRMPSIKTHQKTNKKLKHLFKWQRK